MLAFLVIVAIATSCGGEPKVIEATDSSAQTEGTGVFSTGAQPPLVTNDSPGNVNTSDLHTVVVEEVIPTSKYVYLNVTEGEESFWIATSKQEVTVGETYFYKGGLLKTNFMSQEHNRNFDKIYLVSRIVPVNHGGNGAGNPVKIETHGSDENTMTSEARNIKREGSIRIAEIVKNPAKYEGQTIQISGECVKINPNIMGRNWMHFKDGSQDDYDLVVTSDLAVPEGHVVTMQAKVALNKDFGAGYRYDIILEEGVLLQ
jgi:hypothetical protein